MRRIFLLILVSWIFAVSIGILFAACASGHFSLATLLLPGVVPVALIISTGISILFIPLVIWTARNGTKHLWKRVPILWLTLALYVLSTKTSGAAIYGLAMLAVVGLLVLSIIPRKADQS